MVRSTRIIIVDFKLAELLSRLVDLFFFSASHPGTTTLRILFCFSHQLGSIRLFPLLFSVLLEAPETSPIMATEDERYRQSSQFRFWSFSPSSLEELRSKTNSLAKQQIAPRFAPESAPDFLTPEEERKLVQFFTTELIRAAQFCELPTEIRATAAIFLRRFYVTNSVMTYPPTELLKTSLFFGCKAEGFYYRLAKLAEMFPNTTSEQILAGEFLLCQGMRFAFDVRHPFRALEGAILEIRKQRPEEESRIVMAHAKARDILKFSPLLTDVYFHYTPSQIMMASLMMVDAGLVDILIPPAGQTANGNSGHLREESSAMREKIIKTLEGCKTMMEQEPPERMKNYWETVSAASRQIVLGFVYGFFFGGGNNLS